MVKEKMIKCQMLKIVKATQKFIAEYFEDKILSVTFSNSSASKQKAERGYYNISFVYESGEGEGNVPRFLEEDDYVSRFKKEFSEWLGKEVKYLCVDWSLCVDKSDKKKINHFFSFSIELRV